MPGKKRKHAVAAEDSGSPRLAMDLFIPLPKKTVSLSATDPAAGSLPQKILLERVLQRLAETGYHTVALTHTIYGRPRDPDDRVETVMRGQPINKFVHKSSSSKQPVTLTVLSRLHIVMENASDMTLFAAQSPYHSLLQEYDLVSISPRNELVFQAVSTCAAVDIVTLDGQSTTSNRLPFRLRATDVKAIVNRGAVLEIPYASSVLNRAARKGLVQTGRELCTAAAATGIVRRQFHVLCSSGSRLVENNTDVGPMALRTPSDLSNLCRVVLGLDAPTSINAVSRSGQVALDHATRRRHGRPSIRAITSACIVTNGHEQKDDTPPAFVDKTTSEHAAGSGMADVEEEENEHDDRTEQVEDGFISF